MSEEDDIKKEYIGSCDWTWEMDGYLQIPSLDTQFEAAMKEAWADGKYEALYDDMPDKADVLRLVNAFISNAAIWTKSDSDGYDTKDAKDFLNALKKQIIILEKIIATAT